MMKFLLVLTFVVVATHAEDTGDSTDPCKRCHCEDNAPIFTIDCSNRSLNRIFENWPAKNVTEIRASYTGNEIVTLEALPPTPATLEVVLSKCGIKYLASGLFVATKNIKFVDLSYNLLTADQVSSDKFKGPYNETNYEPLPIENLNLAYNQIHSLSKNIFQHMPNLKHLNLEGNDFRVLDLHTQLALPSAKNLQTLNLANNELTELVKHAIDGLKLIEFDLSRNLLDFVPRSLAHVGATLQVLTLDGNPIIELDSDSFLGLENVRELSANNLTELKYVNANTFVPLNKLKKLHLSNNFRLQDIDREAFGINQTLEEFYLKNNALYRLDYKLLPWSKLHVFEFKENPFDCSCDLYNITTALSRDITRNEDGPYCTDPRNDRSVQVFYLKSDICTYRSKYEMQRQFIQYHFSLLRASLIVLCVILMLVALVGAVIGYTKYRKYQRNAQYPFASAVLYDPLSTNPRF